MTVISTTDAIFLLVAGALAGLVGTAGGITSLASYPALILAGVPPWAAAVANLIAGVACWPGSVMVSRSELRGTGSWARRWAPVSAVGAIVGAALLLATPASVFSGVVPFLVAVASVVLLVQPQLSAWYGRRRSDRDRVILPCGLLSIGVYNGYFGAGAGVMTLALLSVTVQQQMAKANALKNMLVGIVSVVSAVILITFRARTVGGGPAVGRRDVRREHFRAAIGQVPTGRCPQMDCRPYGPRVSGAAMARPELRARLLRSARG